MRPKTMLLSMVLCLWPGMSGATPDASVDADASVVFLRSNCDVEGTPQENCFESMPALTTWIWGTRTPDASSPLLVDIGPGTFGRFDCDGGGYVTLRGAGREQTILAPLGVADFGASIKNCTELSFIDIGFRGLNAAVSWVGTGSSSWSDVDLFADGGTYMAAWYDECDWTPVFSGGDPSAVARSVHYFHGSRIRAAGGGGLASTAFWSKCSETWFFGGEILLDVNSSTSLVASSVYLSEVGDLRVFGTAIRSRGSAGAANGLAGVELSLTPPPSNTSLTEGAFHSHGAIVNTDASNASVDVDVYGIRSTQTTSFAHTPGTAFALTPGGSGTATRIDVSSGGTVLSPFLWQAGDAPPAIASQTGSDLFVERDCDSNGCSGGSDPHLMIYSDACTGAGGPWFDVARAACRQ